MFALPLSGQYGQMARVRSGGWIAEAIAIVCGGLVAVLLMGLAFHMWVSGAAVAISMCVVMAVNARRNTLRRRRRRRRRRLGVRRRATSAGTTHR
jgi:heme exporter protein D